jgi:lysozyme
MISRRRVLGGLTGLTVPALAGCGGRQATAPVSSYAASEATRPSVPGLDAVIDISHNVTVSDFGAVRSSNIHAVIHKATEGGDWVDRSYARNRSEAESKGLLWGAYHFGTRQYSGAEQAQHFLAVARPGPSTLLALDLEPNEGNPANSMRLAQAEAFVQTIQQRTGRLPLVYTHPKWANGTQYGRRRTALDQPVTPGSILARCDLWLADYRERPELPYAWADKGWKLWQYVADEDPSHAAYGTVPRAVPGVSHCDRNLFAGNESELYRFWNVRPRR